MANWSENPSSSTSCLMFTFLLLILCSTALCKPQRDWQSGNSLRFAAQHDGWGKGFRIVESQRHILDEDGKLSLLENSRLKRSVSDESTSVDAKNLTTVAELNDPHTTIVVHWAGQGSKLIIALCKNPTEDSTSLYISLDYGKTFSKLDEKLKSEVDNFTPVIHKYYNSTDNYIFTDIKHNCLFITRDSGKSFKSVCSLPFKPSKLSINPYNHRSVLGIDPESSEKALYYSEDFGETWSVIYFRVKEFFWGVYPYDGDDYEKIIYIHEVQIDGKGHLIKYTNHGSHPPDFDHLAEDILEAHVVGRYIYITKSVVLLGSRVNPHLQLWVSYDREKLTNTNFPINLSSVRVTEFYVVDATEGQLMVCASVNSSYTNLYISEIKGHTFTLSLEKIVYFNPESTNDQNWLRFYTNKTFADITRVAGIPGVYIASQQISNLLDINTQRTLITFDKGGNWEPISAPKSVLALHPDACEKINEERSRSEHFKLDNCSLHLTQEYSRIFPRTQNTPILSEESAPGLILASGMLGATLKSDADLFVSPDAGVTWHEALSGSYLYAMGDHGGILVAVHPSEPTDEIFYSVDEGLTWHAYRFIKDRIIVYGLLTEPGEKSSVFSVFGSYLYHHSWLLIQIDFRNVFDNKVCQDEDYKWWTFSRNPDENGCLMGRLTKYQKRVVHSICFNGRDFVRQITKENCSCGFEDFECDYGFEKTIFMKGCKLIEGLSFGANHNIPSPCPEGTFYPYSRGYRKVSGDTCQGGVEHSLAPLMYSCPISEREEFLLVNMATRVALINLGDGSQRTVNFPGHDIATLVTFDYKENCEIYIERSGAVKRICFSTANEDERHVDTIRESKSGSSVHCLAFDWTGRNLYMCDQDSKTIFVHSVNSTFERQLYDSSKGVFSPRSLVVDPIHGYLFYVDKVSKDSVHYAIYRAAMDGSDHKVTLMVNQTFVTSHTPLTIDLETERLYWDSNGQLATCDFMGKNVTVLSTSFQTTYAAGIGIYKDDVYVAKDMGDSVFLSSKHSSGWWRQFPLQGTLAGIRGLMVVSSVSQHAMSACSDYHRQCSQLCLPKPTSDLVTTMGHLNRTCLCGDEYQKIIQDGTRDEKCACQEGKFLTDAGLCVASTNMTTCNADQYMCHSGHCIYATWLCDGDEDCTDGSDEQDCKLTTCSPGTFTCASGKCILENWRCDGEDDCRDGHETDEANCEDKNCTETQFRCKDNRCIQKAWLCDGDNDCFNNEDEMNCEQTVANCRFWEFQCQEGNCIDETYRCDGINHCYDNSDEVNCTGGGSNCTLRGDFHCKNGNCVRRDWVCDGMDDCFDNSDEQNCNDSFENRTTLRPFDCDGMGIFKCLSGSCIPIMYVCNGINECGDSSDEFGCPETTATYRPPTGTTDYTVETCGDDEYTCEKPENSTRAGVHCVWRSWLCDTDNDCPLGDDEKNCNKDCPPATSFHCLFDGNCIPRSKVCDGRPDCLDESDEGCATTIPPPVTNYTCSKDYFPCGDSAKTCIPFTKVCDKRSNCHNVRDEENCRACEDLGRVYVTTIGHDACDPFDCEASVWFRTTNNSILVHWSKKHPNHNLMLVYSTTFQSGTQTFTRRNLTSIRSEMRISGLLPATTYTFDFMVRLPSGELCNVARTAQTTEDGKSDKPKDVEVLERGNVDHPYILLLWNKPDRSNGQIIGYVVYYQEYSDNLKKPIGNVVRLRIPDFSLHQLPKDNNDIHDYQVPLENYFQWDKHYKIWMAAETAHGESTVTEKKAFLMHPNGNVDFKVTATVAKNDSSAVIVSWKKDKHAVSYQVIGTAVGSQEKISLKVDKTRTSVFVKDLCPGMTFTFSVHALHGGSAETVNEAKQVTIKGSMASILDVSVEKSGPTSVIVKFKTSGNNKGKNYIYYSTHGLSNDAKTLYEPQKVLLSLMNQKEIKGLSACERYFLGVVPTSPTCRMFGIQIFDTGEDEKAPPKNVVPKVMNKGPGQPVMLKLMWEAACYKVSRPLKYVIRVQTGNSLFRSFTTFNATTATHMSFLFPSVVPGQNYTILIRASVEGARETSPLHVQIPTEIFPWHLTVSKVEDEEKSALLKWDWDSSSVPGFKEYRIVTKVEDGTILMENRTKESEISLTLPQMGIYFFKVIAVTNNGVEISQSHKLQFDLFPEDKNQKPHSDKVSLSSTNLVTIIVPVAIGVIALSAGLVFFIVRHRRLQRSFLAFANSHYNIQSGTTTFSEDLDGDEPIIQGFSDDEPLVIA